MWHGDSLTRLSGYVTFWIDLVVRVTGHEMCVPTIEALSMRVKTAVEKPVPSDILASLDLAVAGWTEILEEITSHKGDLPS